MHLLVLQIRIHLEKSETSFLRTGTFQHRRVHRNLKNRVLVFQNAFGFVIKEAGSCYYFDATFHRIPP